MWVKLDDQFWLSDKAAAAGPAPCGFFAFLLSYSGQKLNDGRLTVRDLRTVAAPHAVDWQDYVAALEHAGLLHRVADEEWEIHDFLEYNPSAEQVRDERAKAKERQARWREKRRSEQQQESVTDGVRNGVTNGVTYGVTNGAPTRPDPTRPVPPSEGGVGGERDTNTNALDPQPPSPSAPAKTAAKTTKGTRLPNTWTPSHQLLEWATTAQRLDRRFVTAESEKFVDYWVAVPGQRGVKLDWDATWKNWIRRAAERSPTPTRPTTSDEDQRWLKNR